jgi:hypothetical protein
MVFRAVDTTRVSMAAMSDPIAVSTTTHFVLDISSSWLRRLEVEIRVGRGIHRSSQRSLIVGNEQAGFERTIRNAARDSCATSPARCPRVSSALAPQLALDPA